MPDPQQPATVQHTEAVAAQQTQTLLSAINGIDWKGLAGAAVLLIVGLAPLYVQVFKADPVKTQQVIESLQEGQRRIEAKPAAPIVVTAPESKAADPKQVPAMTAAEFRAMLKEAMQGAKEK